MKKLTFFSLVILSLFQFGSTVWSMGLKLPELPETVAEFSLPENNISLTDSSSPKSFPNLAEGGESQFSSGYWSSDLYPKAIARDGVWDKVKRTWNGEIAYVIEKITGKGRSNIFIWTGVHSFFDSITDAKAHSRGKMKYFSGDDDWHMWKNCRDFSLVMLMLNEGNRIFTEKLTAKGAAGDLACIAFWRFVIHNSVMKISKGGFPAYNDPHYNQHALPYWGLDGKDHYIATGRWSTPICDIISVTAAIYLLKQPETPILNKISVSDGMVGFRTTW
ncbi:MAG: hypothetical protein PHP21_01975 [Patescibacteria group bacterium]|nr:hypothetical protein [Patescibacteria group bacterium]